MSKIKQNSAGDIISWYGFKSVPIIPEDCFLEFFNENFSEVAILHLRNGDTKNIDYGEYLNMHPDATENMIWSHIYYKCRQYVPHGTIYIDQIIAETFFDNPLAGVNCYCF